MSKLETFSNPEFIVRRPVPLEVVQALGAQATDPEIDFYAPLSPQNFYNAFVALADQTHLRPETLAASDDKEYALFTHRTIHGYFNSKYNFETKHGLATNDPMPFARTAFQKRIVEYYDRPDIVLRHTDKTHRATLINRRRDSIFLAEQYSSKFPEIDRTFSLRYQLRESGSFVAAAATGDVLTIYGQALKSFQNRARIEANKAVESHERAKRLKP